MTIADQQPAERTYRLGELFEASAGDRAEVVIRSGLFSRARATLPQGVSLLRDDFPEGRGASCLFFRLTRDNARNIRIVAEGAFDLVSCAAGGWLLESRNAALPSYWIPRLPACRTADANGRILLEEEAAAAGLSVAPNEFAAAFQVPPGLSTDFVVWSIPEQARGLCAELKHLHSVEKARTFFWHSHATYGVPAELYLYLIDGRIYQNARAYPRKWKFCCELDAYGLFVWMTGLERTTHKQLYGLLRRQILASVMARQSADGGWYHGEWTDLNECHYRFHSGALLLLENALDEWGDDAIRGALARGAAFVATRTDDTDLGLWFLHDSLEASAESMNEMHRQTGAIVKHFGAWKPSQMLGKSPTNKLILNTHVDTTIALDRYSELCGDLAIRERIDSARQATRRLLALRPANLLYRSVYWLVRLTLLPESRARELPLPVRVLKRLTRTYVVPNLYRLKRAFPRIVMPGGLIERHLSPLSFNAKYHSVNLMDLVRFWRRFPDERLDEIVDDAVDFVTSNDKAMLGWWAEAKPRRMAIVAFADALYQLCMLKPLPAYRRHLADVLLFMENLGLGLPPSILGGDAEITGRARQVACPSPRDSRLRIANLSTVGHAELLVTNPADCTIGLAWETGPAPQLTWAGADGAAVPGAPGRPEVPPRGWILGRQRAEEAGRVEALAGIHDNSKS